MDDRLRVAADQLGRMRGMTRYYHERFFSDVRFTLVAVLALFVLGLALEGEIFLLIPVVALLGAAATAFDASYLLFTRHYATRLEQLINDELGSTVLVASHLESSYLFPLDTRKLVVAPLGSGFSWFGFMTLLYTALGIAGYGFGLALGLPSLGDHGAGWTVAYLLTLFWLTLVALFAGWWWFVGGEGERRLRTTLDEHFDRDPSGSTSPDDAP